jgi:hypothetical protein
MKTLKRSLSLVLAVVLIVGLLSVGMSANAFTDNSTIRYPVAVNVLTGLGIIDGYPDGSFQPANNVTRAEAAKMVCIAVLGTTATNALPNSTSSFTDMAGNWANPFVQYLAANGIVAGRGDGTFDPNGNVTAYELAKMLLGALGYGKQGEFVGPNWALNVASLSVGDAGSGKILSGNVDQSTIDYSKPATRDEAALYIFNALWAPNYIVNYVDAQKLYVPASVIPGAPPSLASLTLGYKNFYLTYDTGRVIDNAATTNNPKWANMTVLLSNSTSNASFVTNYNSGLELINHAVKVFYNYVTNQAYYVQDLATVTTDSSGIANNQDLVSRYLKYGLAGNGNYSVVAVSMNYATAPIGGSVWSWGDVKDFMDAVPAGMPVTFINNNGYAQNVIQLQTQNLVQVSYITGTGSSAMVGFTTSNLSTTDQKYMAPIPMNQITSTSAPIVVGGMYLVQQAIGTTTEDGMYTFTVPNSVTGYLTKVVTNAATQVGVYTIGGTAYTSNQGDPATENTGWVVNSTGYVTAGWGHTDYMNTNVIAYLDPNGNIVAYGPNNNTNIVYLANLWLDHSTLVGGNKTDVLHGDIYFADGTHQDYIIDQADSTLTLNAATAPIDGSSFNYGVLNQQKSMLGPTAGTTGLLGLYNCYINDDGTAALVNVNYDPSNPTPTATQFPLGGQITNFNTQNGDPLLNAFGGNPAKALYSNDQSLFFYVSGVYGTSSFNVTVKQGTANAVTPVYADPAKTYYDIETYTNQQQGSNATGSIVNNFVTATLLGAPATAAAAPSIYFFNQGAADVQENTDCDGIGVNQGTTPSYTYNVIDINTGALVSITTSNDPRSLTYPGTPTAASPTDNFFVSVSGGVISVKNTVGDFNVTSSVYRDRNVNGGLFSVNKSSVEINEGYFASGAPMQMGRYGINSNTVFVDLSGTSAQPIQVLTGNAFRDYFRDGQLITFAVYADGSTISGVNNTFAMANTVFVLSVS